MARNSKLGKGLKALIAEDIQFDDDGSVIGPDGKKDDEGIVFELDISKIRPNADQPRKNFDKTALEEMAASIREHGVLQPLVVRKDDDGYTIIAGERRFRAANMAGLETVPVIVKDLSDKDVMEIALIENVQREDLNPIEEAMAYEKLIKDYHLTQNEIGKQIGKSRAAVANIIRLLNLPESVRKMVLDGKLTSGHARALLGLEKPEDMEKLAGEIVKNNLNVRETERRVREFGKKQKVKKPRERDPYLVDVEERLKEHFNTGVKIKSKGEKGRIELEYYSMDDLNRLLEMLNIIGRHSS